MSFPAVETDLLAAIAAEPDAIEPRLIYGDWLQARNDPRGEWFEYKYTRGDWDSVEKGTGCSERPNRYRFGDPKSQSDVVDAWRDRC